MTEKEKIRLETIACEIRKGIVTAVYNAKSGHPGGSLSAAELFTYLYFKEMNINPANPEMPDRDRFVLSKGHTAPGLYSALAYRGFFPVEDLLTLRRIDSCLQGHPNMNTVPGVDMSTGSLGQGISAAVGMAKAGKYLKRDFRVYTLLGDGEIQEGQVWEALMFAAHYSLDNLCVIIDNNNLQIDGHCDEVLSPYPIMDKLKAFGFEAVEINGHSFEEIEDAMNRARITEGSPFAIVMRTVKGKGISYMEDNGGWHGKAPNEEEYKAAMKELDARLAELEVM